MSARRKKKAPDLRITYVKSVIGYSQKQKATLRALGLRRLGDTVVHSDTPVLRGMVDKIGHLLSVEEDRK